MTDIQDGPSLPTPPLQRGDDSAQPSSPVIQADRTTEEIVAQLSESTGQPEDANFGEKATLAKVAAVPTSNSVGEGASTEPSQDSTSALHGSAQVTKEDEDKEHPPDGAFAPNLIPDLIDFAARELTSTQLFEVYQKKLRRDADAFGSKRQDPAPLLLRSFANLLESLEKRLEKLEQGSGIETRDKEPEPAHGGDPGHGVETRFYNIDNQFRVPDGGAKEDAWKIKGSFESEVDRKHCLRVLFRWTVSGIDRPDDEINANPPDPGTVEIEELRIGSEAIASFLEKIYDYEFHKDGILHLRKPFRCLIPEAAAIKKQLASLEATFDDGDHDVETSDAAELVRSSDPDLSQTGRDSRNRDSQVPVASAHSSTIPAFEKQSALVEFRELVKFMDTYLAEEIDLFNTYQLGKEPKIEFSNLWMLFGADEEVYCAKKSSEKIVDEADAERTFTTAKWETPQIYRILAVGGGIPVTRETLPRWALWAVEDPGQKLGGGKNTLQKSFFEAPGTLRMRDKFTPLCLDCYLLVFDGNQFVARVHSFEIKPFDGEVDITSLAAYPMRYRDANATQHSLEYFIERGRQYAELTAVSHRSYEGFTIGDDKEEVNSRVIVDFKTAYQHDEEWQPVINSNYLVSWKEEPRQSLEIPKRFCSHGSCHLSGCVQDSYLARQRSLCDKTIRDINSQLDDYRLGSSGPDNEIERFIRDMKEKGLITLLPGLAYAYVLRSRKWVVVDITKLRPVVQDENWDDLVLPDGHKDIVRAMVETHATGSRPVSGQAPEDFEADLVRGKGKGCIILLHGEPGVGKTSTAECVAAYTNRPLYPITCGDIGTTPEEVEKSMELHFTLAHKWGCVLLLDEADVFLAKRSRSGNDITRNGLVSVFLRILEYYSGILFLTTNRVGTFDDAFRSRIHVMLYYPKLTHQRAFKIWKNNLKRLKEHSQERVQNGRTEIAIKKKQILEHAKEQLKEQYWNGRQIRNAFQTALALAEFEAQQQQKQEQEGSATTRGPTVTKEHFARIARATADFEVYIDQLHGLDEDRRAKRGGERTLFTPTGSKTTPRRRDLPEDKDDPFSFSDSETDPADKAEPSDDDGSVSEPDSSGNELRRKQIKKKGTSGQKGEKPMRAH